MKHERPDERGKDKKAKPYSRPLRAVRLLRAAPFLAAAGVVLGGCDASKSANIVLRKQIQQQQETIERLQRQHAADEAVPRAATRPASGPGARPALPMEQLAGLYTVHGIRLGRLTGVRDGRLTVYLIPVDQDGDDLKAAGEITVDVYDLTADGRRVAQVAHSAADAMKLWHGAGLRYEYVIPCPLPQPSAGELTVRVSFLDALSGRRYDLQQVVSVAE